MEEIDTLFAYKTSTKIIQEKNSYSYSVDSILLSFFLDLKKTTNKIIDFGSGPGTIPLILSNFKKMDIYGIEIQKAQYDRSIRSLKLNNIDDIHLINDDIKNVKNLFNPSSFDMVVSNPPYYKMSESNMLNKSEEVLISRHEKLITLEDIIKNANYLLKDNGSLSLIIRTDRFNETISLFNKYNIAPKRIRFIYPKLNKESYAFMIDGRKNGNMTGLKVLEPLYVYKDNNDFSTEVLEYFHFKENEKK